jgi:gamma-glutamyltranspeptidase
MILGSAGNDRIQPSIVRTAVSVMDHGLALEEALNTRRWHIDDDQLHIELMGLGEGVLARLRELGYTLRTYEGLDGFFAKVHAVMVDADEGALYGAGDPRDVGGARGR